MPFVVFTVTVVFPTDTPVISPFETVAISGFFEVHFTIGEAPTGLTLAVTFVEVASLMVTDDVLTSKFVGSTTEIWPLSIGTTTPPSVKY